MLPVTITHRSEWVVYHWARAAPRLAARPARRPCWHGPDPAQHPSSIVTDMCKSASATMSGALGRKHYGDNVSTAALDANAVSSRSNHSPTLERRAHVPAASKRVMAHTILGLLIAGCWQRPHVQPDAPRWRVHRRFARIARRAFQTPSAATISLRRCDCSRENRAKPTCEPGGTGNVRSAAFHDGDPWPEVDGSNCLPAIYTPETILPSISP
jgi:hypothetical protein